jgi:hypothetical protein
VARPATPDPVPGGASTIHILLDLNHSVMRVAGDGLNALAGIKMLQGT